MMNMNSGRFRDEVEQFRDLGADGVVIGILNPDGTLNVEQMAELVKAAGGIGVTMHRAFDVCRDPFESIGAVCISGN